MRIIRPNIHRVDSFTSKRAAKKALSRDNFPTPCLPSTLRIATLNVHNWVDSRMKPNLQRLIAMIDPLKIDILSLNEVWVDNSFENKDDSDDEYDREASSLEQLAQACGFKYFVFGHADYEEYGNAVLSRYPISDAINCVSRIAVGHRAMLCIKLTQLPTVLFCSTHLDHIKEENRLNQWMEFADVLSFWVRGGNRSAQGIVGTVIDEQKDRYRRLHMQDMTSSGIEQIFVLGDFNALTRGDYSDEELYEVARVRSKGAWESPQFGLMNTLRQMEFTDILQSVMRKKNQYPPHVNNAVNGIKVAFDLSTCRFNTRIDYILQWHRTDSALLKVKEASIVDSNECTDHNLVMSDVVLITQK